MSQDFLDPKLFFKIFYFFHISEMEYWFFFYISWQLQKVSLQNDFDCSEKCLPEILFVPLTDFFRYFRHLLEGCHYSPPSLPSTAVKFSFDFCLLCFLHETDEFPLRTTSLYGCVTVHTDTSSLSRFRLKAIKIKREYLSQRGAIRGQFPWAKRKNHLN